MSGGHFDYKEYCLGEIIESLKEDYIGTDQPENYNGLNEEYYKSIEERMKVPEWIWKSLEVYSEILHEIDYDISGDSSIKKGYFKKQKDKLTNILTNNL